MRLVDADAFVQFLKDAVKKQKYENLKIDGLLTVADVIDAVICDLNGTSLDGFKNAPTIELKKEAKTPRWVAEDRFVKGKYFLFPHCPKCNGELTTGQCYCSICGQHIGWDEEEGADR